MFFPRDKQPFGDFLIDLMNRAEERNVEISEFTLTEAQAEVLSAEYCMRHDPSPSKVAMFNGARITIVPPPMTPAQKAAAALRKAADDIEAADSARTRSAT